ncbi:MAG: sensor histidine kinase [Bryobacteraceae bacterium]
MTSIDMNGLLDEVMRHLPLDHDRPSVVWEISALPKVQGHPTLLRLVWQNLLANALEFTRGRERPRIEIKAVEDEAEVVFSVTDNGVGFKQAYANKLFGVFQRLPFAGGI